jgi:hypothetical protein
MECVIGLYKTECIRTTVFHAGPYRTISDAFTRTSSPKLDIASRAQLAATVAEHRNAARQHAS